MIRKYSLLFALFLLGCEPPIIHEIKGHETFLLTEEKWVVVEKDDVCKKLYDINPNLPKVSKELIGENRLKIRDKHNNTKTTYKHLAKDLQAEKVIAYKGATQSAWVYFTASDPDRVYFEAYLLKDDRGELYCSFALALSNDKT